MAAHTPAMALNEPGEKALGVTTDIDVSTAKDEQDSISDGDDAIKLAGTQAHVFDEEYYARLRRKIVRDSSKLHFGKG